MPKPEKHVFVCTQSRPAGHPRGSCGENGCRELWEGFVNELEKRQLFDKIAITNTGCLGPCSTGANVLVYPEGVMYGMHRHFKRWLENHATDHFRFQERHPRRPDQEDGLL